VPGTTDQRYWDSATCLAYLLDEAGRADACQLVLDAAEDGKLELVISTLTIAEVLALRGKAALAQDDPNPRVRVHLAYIRPDVQMGGLLKETPSAQLFTVFGAPRTELREEGDGTYTVEMQGVDVYDPVQNVLQPTRADKVAAWFLDADYDGATFCVSQAFFPDRSAWDKLARALKGRVDDGAWDAFAGTVSLPFAAGEHRRVAVKVIDPRGNEVMRVHRLPAATHA